MTDSNNAEVQKVVESAEGAVPEAADLEELCLLYTSPSPRDCS